MKRNLNQKDESKETSLEDERQETEFSSIMALVNERYKLDKEIDDIQTKNSSLVLKYMQEGKFDEIKNLPGLKEAQEKRKAFKQKYILHPDEMRIIIAEKKSKNIPGRNLNCEVFDNMASDEFKKYLSELAKNAEALVGQRFQVVIQSSKPLGLDYHWSAADILIKENGIEILHFDTIVSSGKPQGGANGDELETVLKSIHFSKPIKMIDSHTQFDDLDVSTQRDGESCSIFAVSSALTMSKISDLHDLASDHMTLITEHPEHNDNVTRYSMPAENLPTRLLKNAQDSRVIENYQGIHKDNTLNKIPTKGGVKSIEEYTATRSHMIPSIKASETKRKQNLGILYTREHYKKSVEKRKKQLNTSNSENKAFFDSNARNIPDEHPKNEEVKTPNTTNISEKSNSTVDVKIKSKT